MRIAIISDIHENFHNLILSFDEMEKRGVDKILCLGDLMNAGIAKLIAFQPISSFLIWGNNDGEKVDVVKASFREGSNMEVSNNTYDFLELGGKKIFITHHNDLAIPMAESGNYDAVFYGHDHIRRQAKIVDCHVVNPGELCAQKSGVASFAIYDTEIDQVDIIELKNSITLKSKLVDDYLRANMERLNFRSKDSFNQV